MPKAFEITVPLPARGSAAALRQQLVDHLLRTRPTVGERFFSDHELARLSQLSRPTVRRALDDLERDGWIERRPGIGTFIGPRAAVGPAAHHDGNGGGNGHSHRAVRLALMIHMIGDFGHDWYAAGVMNGIDHAASETGVSLELLGDRDGDVKTTSRRLMQSRPDVLAFAAPPLRHISLIGEARRLGISCIGTGTLLEKIGVPTVCEDGTDAARRGVRYLVENGHRRIGLVLAPFALPWVFDRRQGWVDGLHESGMEADEGMVCWLSGDDHEQQADALMRYLDRRQPTALLFGSWVFVQALAPLVRAGKVRVPQDLSVVTFDQHPNLEMWLGVRPTTLALPLLDMGRELAQLARNLTHQEDVSPVTTLPCELITGDSVVTRQSS